MNEIFDGIRTFAGRSAHIIESSASIATLQLKKKDAEKKLWDAYALMGKYAYEGLCEDVNRTEEMQLQMKEIQAARAVLKDLNERLDEARANADESDEEVRAERAAMQEKKKRARAAAAEVYRNELNRKK